MNTLDGIKFEPCLVDANVYRLKRNGNWVAKILMNGEMTVATQEAILGAMLAKPDNQPPPSWEPLFPVMLNSLDGAYWIATKSGRVMAGVYEWLQGHNPHGFKTYGGERVSADAVTHLMRYSTPLPPNAATGEPHE